MEEKDACECIEGKECTCNDACECEEECTCDDACECKEDLEEESESDSECDCKEKKNKKDKKDKKIKGKKEIELLNEKIKELENKVLKEKAELINYQKRKDNELSYSLKYANEDLVKEILPIVDNFERAIKFDNDDDLEDELSKFLAGFKMIYCHLVKALETYGVKAIDGDSKAFDPTYHQAVLTEKREGVESGMVLEVMQKGYLLKDKVIRPAMVKVSE